MQRWPLVLVVSLVACDHGIFGPPDWLAVSGTVTVAGEYVQDGRVQVGGPPYVDVVSGAYQLRLISYGCRQDKTYNVRAVLFEDSIPVAEQWSEPLPCGDHFVEFRFP